MLDRLRRTLILAPLACAAIYACGGGETDPDNTELPKGYEDVVLAGDVTDETLVGFVAALEEGTPTDDPAQAPAIVKPAQWDELPVGTIATFSWTFGTSARLGPRTPAAEWAALAPAPARDLAAFAAPLCELLSAPRLARAHGEPYNGTATFVELTAKDGTRLLRVLTSDQKLTPAQAEWDAMAAAAQPITIKLTSAIFEENRVSADGGPFAGSTVEFTIVE